ncbi:MAG: hypothetical protein JWL72_1153 [Ilumatobacteraceae bacterium]|nr:hypothetical protein [Ilumatobacteraceae bacterium]
MIGMNARLVWLLIVTIFCATSCRVLDQPAQSASTQLPNMMPVAVNGSTGPESTSGPAGNTASSAFVDDCVRYIRTGAFTGNVALVRLLDSTHDDADALRTICVDYGQPDLRGLEELPIARPRPPATRRGGRPPSESDRRRSGLIAT